MENSQLTIEEKQALGRAIGVGYHEIEAYTFTMLEGPVLSACVKLGIVPLDWHGDSILPKEYQ